MKLAEFMKSHEVFGRDKINLMNIVNGDVASNDTTNLVVSVIYNLSNVLMIPFNILHYEL